MENNYEWSPINAKSPQITTAPAEKLTGDEEWGHIKEPESWIGQAGRVAANIGKEVVKGVVNFPGDLVNLVGSAASYVTPDTKELGSNLGSGNVITDAISKIMPEGGILPSTKNEYVEKAFKSVAPEGYFEPKGPVEAGVIKWASTLLGLALPVPGGKVNAAKAAAATGLGIGGEWIGKKFDLGPKWTSALSGTGMFLGLLGPRFGLNDAITKAVEPLAHNPKAAEAMTAKFMKEAKEANSVYSWMNKIGDKFSKKLNIENPIAKWALGGTVAGIPITTRVVQHLLPEGASWAPEALALGAGGVAVGATWLAANVQTLGKMLTKYPVLRKSYTATVKSAIKQEIPSYIKNAARFDKEMSKHTNEFEWQAMPQG